jgi:type II secretory pathway component GspD/PulD (secretin)
MAKHIGRILSGGVMALCVIVLFTPETYGQVGGTILKYRISGNVGEAGVTMQGLGTPAPMTDENGVYSAEVRYGWSGTVTPVKAGFTFEPKQRAYSNVIEDKSTEDYKATVQMFVIAGTTEKPGVKLRGLPEDPNSDPNGRYSVKVPYGWNGTVVPELRGFRFDPPSRDYSQVIDDKKNDSYKAQVQTFTISGSVGAEGVVMKGLPGDPKTNKDGVYRADVPFEWSGKVQPTKEGYEFAPESQDYSAVTDNYENQDYVAHVFTFEISGSAGMAGVVMAGLPGDPITDLDGRYTAVVEYGWSGKITPQRSGYSFKPSAIDITRVTDNKPNQDFAGSINKYRISGTTGTGAVKLVGLPEEITSTSTGSYTATVEFGWTGTITPEKEGYTFDPQSLFLPSVEKDLPRQDFKSKAITCAISGTVGIAGVEMRGLPGRVISGQDGSYSVEVPYKWKGTVTPLKEGYTFDPDKKEYTDGVVESATAEDYTYMIKQYAVSGRITSDKGIPLADVFVMTDQQNVSTVTDTNGEFTLNVDHGSSLKLTPQKPGCTFTPVIKSVGPVMQNLPNQSFVGKMRMVTITDSIVVDGEPVQGVMIKDKTGNYTATTNAKGIYSIQVPYGWTGELFWTKPGFVFDPPSELHQNLTESIDRTGTQPPPPAPTPAKPAVTPTEAPGLAATPPSPAKPGLTAADILRGQKPPEEKTTAPAKPTEPTAPAALTEQQILDQMVKEYKERLRQAGIRVDTNDLSKAVIQPSGVPSNLGPIVSGTFAGTVIDVLRQVSQQTGAKVYADATVKPDPIQPVTIAAMPMASALSLILKSTSYQFRRIEKPEEAWQVFRPISNSFTGSDLRQVLQDIGAMAGVSIVPDETVSGQVYADLQGVPLEVALETVLAGTSYVVKSYPNYYLVADRKVESSAFDKISETRLVRLNYITPNSAKSLLSPFFTQYVQAEMDPNSHLMTVTAPAEIADRIVSEIKDMDVRPHHVLLDARIVAMDRGDLLNIGVDWGMPAMQAGFYGNADQRGTLPTGVADPAGKWPWGISVGLSFDNAFTNSLTAAINLLRENNKADIISNPQIVAQDGRRSRIQAIQEEYFMMTAPINQNMFYTQSQLETVKSGTTLEITPLIGDNNDITMELAVEVSDSIPKGRGSDLPVVTRRTAQNSVVIKDGGTVAVAGLTENRTRDKDSRVPFLSDIPGLGRLFRNTDSDKATREIAVFVTAHIVPEASLTTRPLSGASDTGRIMSPAGDSFQQELRNEMTR